MFDKMTNADAIGCAFIMLTIALGIIASQYPSDPAIIAVGMSISFAIAAFICGHLDRKERHKDDI